MDEIKSGVEIYDKTKISNGVVNQSDLDLDHDRNHNLFTYKGQFSPDLINNLIRNYAPKNSLVLDPFCGCGTVLFEAAKQNHSAIGIDINPAGILMAESSRFHNLNKKQRLNIFNKTKKLVETIPSFKSPTFEKLLVEKIVNQTNKYIKNLLINSYLKYSTSRKSKGKILFQKILEEHITLIQSLPYSRKEYKVFHSDVRNSKIDLNSVDLIITSPPYINVVNYHQHYRNITEEFGFNALNIAKSEFGSNRKNRQNRFLTVIQYIFDMTETMNQLKSYLKKDGRFIIVIGRQSKVRGVSFRNDLIIGVISLILGYNIDLHQERKFKNQYGEVIYEDILHFKKSNDSLDYDKSKLLNLAEYVLREAMKEKIDSDIINDVELALESLKKTETSPLYINEVSK